MTDVLGQSQVIPYLTKLSEYGFKIDILSAEKPENYSKQKDIIADLLKKSGINWHTIDYTKTPAIISTIKDLRKLKKKAKLLTHQNKYEIIHCRSYIPAFVGVYLKKKFNAKFLFDMRGFYADERVDGNLWNQSYIIFKFIYKYFKKKENRFFTNADYTISLTYAGKEIIRKMKGLQNIPIEVIPCCADLDLFDYNKINETEKENLRKELNISADNFVLTYLGSVGTWYMLDEMMEFFAVLKQNKPESKFLFITRENRELIYNSATNYNVDKNDLIIISANREEVPKLLSLSNVSIFFILPVFSKKASSPTKFAEILSMGIPIICNSDVGDLDKFVYENNTGLIINNFEKKQYEDAVKKIEEILKINPEHLRNVAVKLFSLKIGTEKYKKVYDKLLFGF